MYEADTRTGRMATPLNNSVLKGFEILSLFSPSRREISSATVVERMGMNNATAHRFLMTLEHAGAVRSTKRGYYALGPKIEELGWIAEETDALAQVLQPEIDGLSRDLNESVMVCRLTRHGPTCVAVANSTRPISVNITVGTLLPLHSTAQGKLWLAEMSPAERSARLSAQKVVGSQTPNSIAEKLETELARIRDQGYALNLGDNEPDIAAVSVPIRDTAGKTVLTLSAFGMLSRFDARFLGKARDRLLATAGRIRGKPTFDPK